MRRREVETPSLDVSHHEQVLTRAETIVRGGQPLTSVDYDAVEAVLDVDPRRHLELTMCRMSPAQELSHRRWRVAAGTFGRPK